MLKQCFEVNHKIRFVQKMLRIITVLLFDFIYILNLIDCVSQIANLECKNSAGLYVVCMGASWGGG